MYITCGFGSHLSFRKWQIIFYWWKWGSSYKTTLWHQLMRPSYEITIWDHLTRPPYMTILWDHFMKPLYETTLWDHRTRLSYETTLWNDLTISPYNITLRDHLTRPLYQWPPDKRLRPPYVTSWQDSEISLWDHFINPYETAP